MKKLLFDSYNKLILVLLLLLPTIVFAADNAVILTPGTGVTMRSIDIGAGVQSSGVNLVGSTGASILGTAGTANANVITIQGIASGTVIPVSLANGGSVALGSTTDAACSTDNGTCTQISLIKRNNQLITSSTILTGTNASPSSAFVSVTGGLAQGSTTSGQTGSLILGAVLTAAPTYTTAQTSPLSITPTGYLRATNDDPCQTVVKTYTPISITTATTTRIIAPTASKKTYICYMYLQTTAANNIAVVEGTGGTCGSGTAGVVGGTTAANGLNNAANSGQAFGNGGFAALATAGTNVDLCLITSAATPLAGHVAWVAQ